MEYQILQADTLINVEQLNELAAQAWELITIIQVENIFYFYFRRLTM